MASIKYARTASGGVSVQVVEKVDGRTRVLKHVGTAHSDAQLAALFVVAEEFIGPDLQLGLDLGVDVPARRTPPRMADISNYHHKVQSELAIPVGSVSAAFDTARPGRRAESSDSVKVVASPNLLAWDVLMRVWGDLGFDVGDDVFRSIVLARVIAPTSKREIPRVLEAAGQPRVHVNTIYNALKRCIDRDYQKHIESRCHKYVRAHTQVTMVLYDCTTLYFETAKEDELRKVGMSKERRVDPQIVVGLITDNVGFPLHVEFFHGKTAETTTLIPAITAYISAHDLAGVVVVADAAMLSAANLDALDEAGIDYIVADRLKKAPYAIAITDDDLEEWSKKTATFEFVEETKTMRGKNADTTRRVVMGFSPKRYTYDVYTLGKQKEKAEKVVAGHASSRLPRFVKKEGGKLVVNKAVYDKALSLAGWKGYVTSLDKNQVSAQQVVNYYHDLYHVEQAFRMAKTDLQARPIFHRRTQSIHAHLIVVLAAMAISKHIYLVTKTPAPKLITELQRHRHAVINTGRDTITVPPRIDPQTQALIDQLTNWKPGD